MKKLLTAFIALIAFSALINSCGGRKATESTSSSSASPTPAPTPITTNYDVCYYEFGASYNEYYLFDFESGSGVDINEYKTFRGRKPSSPGSVRYFTFTGSFEDGLQAKYCDNGKITIWKYSGTDQKYIYPTYVDEKGNQSSAGALGACEKVKVESVVRFMTNTLKEKEITGCPVN